MIEQRKKLEPQFFEELTNKFGKKLAADSHQDSPYFDLLFAYTLRQTCLQQLNGFLEYQKDHYEGDFYTFLQLCINEHSSVLEEKQIDATYEWIKANGNKKENCIEIKKPKVIKRVKQDNITELSVDQTAYLFHHLKIAKVLINDRTIQNNMEIAKTVSALTGYSSETIRQALSKLEAKNNEDDIKVTQKTLQKINNLIYKDLKNISN